MEFFRFLFSDPMWWVPLLLLPVICCAVVGIKFPKRLWIAPVTMMLMGVVSMWFHIPLTDYIRSFAGVYVPHRNNEFWGFGLIVWIFFLVYQSIAAFLFTGVTWILIKTMQKF